MSQERFARYSEIYSIIGHVRERQNEELLLEGALAPLAFDTRLDSHDRNGFISRLGELDRLNGQVSGGAAALFSVAEKQGIRLPRDTAEARIIRLQGFGACLLRPSVPLG